MDCSAEDTQAEAFQAKCGELFGEGAALSPANLIDNKRFEIKAADVTIAMPPEQSYLVKTQIIDGKKYLLIPADERLEVNGMPVD